MTITLARSLIIFMTVLMGVFLASGCKSGGAAFTIAQANVARDENPSVPASDLSAVVQGNTAFATDLYGLLKMEEGNLFFSPYSISVALAMTYAGAGSNTASEMAETLHFGLPQAQLHAAFNRLSLELEERSKVKTDGDKAEPFQLSIANSIWAEKTYEFLDSFLQTLALNYGAGARRVDFIGDAEGARKAINTWVKDETKARIPELIPQGVINAMTSFVLTNAIYFKASWEDPFPKDLTRGDEFHLLSGSRVTAAMMRSSAPLQLAYAESPGLQAVELPYVGDEVTMLVILPAQGSFAEFEAGFDAARLDAILASLQSQAVSVILPKFEFSSDVPLKQTLVQLGMPTAFEPGAADFSGMDGTRNLYIQDVLHKAFVAVDEQGTEAGAATAVVMGVTSAPAEPKLFEANRPFVFLVRDRVTGTVLFVGRVIDPTE